MTTIVVGSPASGNSLAAASAPEELIEPVEPERVVAGVGFTVVVVVEPVARVAVGFGAALRTGEMVGMIAQGEENDTEEYKTSAISGKINLDMTKIKEEEKNYIKMPTYYSFKDKLGADRKEDVLMTNFRRINKEIEILVNEFVK